MLILLRRVFFLGDGLLFIFKHFFGQQIAARWKEKCSGPGYCLVNMADRIVKRSTQAKRDLIENVMRKGLQSFIKDPIFRIVRPATITNTRGTSENERTAIHSLSAGIGDRTIYLVAQLWCHEKTKVFTMTADQRRNVATASPSALHLTNFEEASRDVSFIRDVFKKHLQNPSAVEAGLGWDLEDSEDEEEDEEEEEVEDLVGEKFIDLATSIEHTVIAQYINDADDLVCKETPDNDEWSYEYVKERVDARRAE